MHLDDETLALLALGDTELDAGQRAHLATCATCSGELDELVRTVNLGRSSRDVELLTPPDRVWSAVQSELGLTGASPAPVPIEQARRRSGFSRWWPLTVAALVVGIVAGVAGAAFWPQPSATVVAQAVLDPFPTWDASGTARLEAGSSGSHDLLVTLTAPSGTDLREVWLMDPTTNGLVSLGLLSGSSGRFTVPSDVDLRRYSVVDISDEPNDGNPAHSGDSIVRGQLNPV